MTDQQPRPVEGTTSAPERTIPEQAVPPVEEAVAPPEGAVAPAEETIEHATEQTLTTPVEEPAEAVEEAPPEKSRRRRRRPRRQSAFRRWRKTRPFWGGLLTMIAGIEIAGITAASYELLFVSKSVGFAIAVGLSIVALGLTMWLTPALSKLLGLLTLVAALLSFVTSNLGGFLLGMILAILGGGLAFAWEPGHRPEPLDQSAAPEAGDETDVEAQALVPEQRTAAEYEPLDDLLEG